MRGRDAAVVWHDVECGAYEADLPLWEELADEAEGTVLDLGCGTGRVSLHLAKRKHEVHGLDREAGLVAVFNERADGLPADAAVDDARTFQIEREFGLAIAPMQLIQLLGTRQERMACLSRIARHLRSGGRAALSIAENVLGGTNRRSDGSIAEPHALPDAREIDGWVYSSLPLETVVEPDRIVVSRLRQIVSPAGELSDEEDSVSLSVLPAETMMQEARAAGLRPLGLREIPATEAHVGSTVVLLRKED